MSGNHENVNALLRDIPIPKMYRVRQIFDTARLEDPAAALREELNRPGIRERVKPGMSIAVTAGSRGIDNIVLILRETVRFLQEAGANPFIIPAMGSHGGATAEGQVAILESLGITIESVGCPIRATMEVVNLTHLADGTPVRMDRYAYEADGVVVVNRVKPHTGFRGRYESGLFKMMTVGLGKQKGAELTHGRGRLRMGETIEMCGNAYLDRAKILFGVATVENSFDKTWKLAALTPQEIREQEPELLLKARDLLPSLRLQYADVLVVDTMGKNISGTGMDTNITRSYTHGYGISREGRAKRIAVLDLTDESHGSAVGIGQADVTTQRMFEKIDFNTTYPNLLTSGGTDSAKIPMVLDNQRLAIQAAIKTSAGSDPEHVKLIRIRDTLHITEIEVSEAFIEEARKTEGLEVLEGPFELAFDENGNLF
ncbi:MAG: DUF2088 domain-containing protein [Clostridia bacterium]|nr:DUF2088 domain-containing protein [Clostridia bacterium]